MFLYVDSGRNSAEENWEGMSLYLELVNCERDL